MKLLNSIIELFSILKDSSQLEYHIRQKKPQTHSELDRIVRDYYSIRGL
jgi:hypothetical protein